MQYETSATHRKNTELGLSVEWVRQSESKGDLEFNVVAYSDGSRWLFDNGSADKLTKLGLVSDGVNRSEVLETSCGAIVALYDVGPMCFCDRRDWIESLPESDREEAEAMLSNL